MNDLDEARWSAVLGHDRAADSVFVYAVRSTGVFCRPSCPSRRPLRRNVEFFPTGGEAGRAGYRPCLRCRPDTIAPSDPVSAKVVLACRLLEQVEPPEDLAALGHRVGWSPHHLQRTFRRVVGVTPHRYADAARLDRAKRALREGATVTDAVYEAGYGSSRGFYERASVRMGMAPSSYAAGGAGMVVRYTFVRSGLGLLLVAATERGLCKVRFGGGRRALVDALRAELPRARLERADEELAEAAGVVSELAEGGPADVHLPLDVRATAFQARVWEALRQIPHGHTRSYAGVAAALGTPSATRAVANACGANPVALVIPCHRVVRSDGTLGGYRWGIEIKAALLRREAQAGSAAPTAS